MRRQKSLPLPRLRSFWPSWQEAKPVLSIYLPVSFIVICVLSMYACMSGFVNQTQPPLGRSLNASEMASKCFNMPRLGVASAAISGGSTSQIGL